MFEVGWFSDTGAHSDYDGSFILTTRCTHGRRRHLPVPASLIKCQTNLLGSNNPEGSRIRHGQTFPLAYTQERQSPPRSVRFLPSPQFGIRMLEFFCRSLKVKKIIYLWRKHKFFTVKEGGHDFEGGRGVVDSRFLGVFFYIRRQKTWQSLLLYCFFFCLREKEAPSYASIETLPTD